MGGKGRRRLGPEERGLWERVAATTSPLRRQPRPTRESVLADHTDRSTAPPDPVAPTARLQETAPTPRSAAVRAAAGSTTLRLAAPEAAPVGRPEAGLDRRTAERLRKGSRAPDARIDLHGLTAERAHRVCLRFVGEAIGRGDRVVLVITGKGRGAGGVLRDSLPAWLRASPVSQSIVGIYQAHRRHGGEGAFYVYLKRRR